MLLLSMLIKVSLSSSGRTGLDFCDPCSVLKIVLLAFTFVEKSLDVWSHCLEGSEIGRATVYSVGAVHSGELKK